MTRRGFTLLEVIVVLVVMGLTAALVAPALLPPRQTTASIQTVVRGVQRLALRRGETMLLEISQEGAWAATGTSSAIDGAVASGVLPDPHPRGDLALRVSPLGSCAWVLEASPSAWRPPLDPLTCRIGLE
jgi:prepilin-type N-terminal cleavage/methylation domain-containing protein